MSREFTFLAQEPVERTPMGWVIDSGASQHLCGNRTQFTSYTNFSIDQAITIADGTKIQAIGSGEVVLATEEGTMTLMGVWNVPKIRRNLISISRMVDAGYTIEFGPISC